MPRFNQADIYWLTDCDPLDDDNTKDRPVIVLQKLSFNRSSRPVLVVACSTRPRKNEMDFRLPDRREDPRTGLSRECWAIPRWYLHVNPHRLNERSGRCPDELFNDLLEAVLDRMDSDPS